MTRAILPIGVLLGLVLAMALQRYVGAM